MKRSTKLPGVLAAAMVTMVVAPVTADDEHRVTTRLTGYQETPVTLNSAASGEFKARIRDHETVIKYELTYRDLSSMPTQAHIHFGRPATTGSIVLFLCTNLTPPTGVPLPPACPVPETVMPIEGTLTAADVIARPAQGIDAGAAGFAEMLKAIRAGAAYVNMHTMSFPSGEIRGGLRAHGHDDH